MDVCDADTVGDDVVIPGEAVSVPYRLEATHIQRSRLLRTPLYPGLQKIPAHVILMIPHK